MSCLYGCSCLAPPVSFVAPFFIVYVCVRMCVLIFVFHCVLFSFFVNDCFNVVGMVAVFPDIRLVSWPFSWREKPSRFAPHVHIHAERNAD